MKNIIKKLIFPLLFGLTSFQSCVDKDYKTAFLIGSEGIAIKNSGNALVPIDTNFDKEVDKYIEFDKTSTDKILEKYNNKNGIYLIEYKKNSTGKNKIKKIKEI
jgi:hypothetical protein